MPCVDLHQSNSLYMLSIFIDIWPAGRLVWRARSCGGVGGSLNQGTSFTGSSLGQVPFLTWRGVVVDAIFPDAVLLKVRKSDRWMMLLGIFLRYRRRWLITVFHHISFLFLATVDPSVHACQSMILTTYTTYTSWFIFLVGMGVGRPDVGRWSIFPL